MKPLERMHIVAGIFAWGEEDYKWSSGTEGKQLYYCGWVFRGSVGFPGCRV